MTRFLHPSLGWVNYEVQEVPDDADGQVAEVIGIMTGYTEADAQSPVIRAQALSALEKNPGDPLAAVFNHVRRHMRFIKDEEITAPFGELAKWRPFAEALIRPVDVASDPRWRFGDCDDFSMYTACLLLNLGIPCSFVTIAADVDDPGRFSHVYVAAYPGEGERVALDTSHGQYPGWESPHPYRIKEWELGTGRVIRQWALVGAILLGGWWAYRKGWLN